MHDGDPGARVETLLERGVRELVNKAFFIRLAMLKRGLGVDGDGARFGPIFEMIRCFAPTDVCRLATPFFWFNLLRLDVTSPSEVAIFGFLTTAVDSFLPAMPPDTVIELDVPATRTGYAFPALGLRFALAPGDRLRHVGNGRIVHEPRYNAAEARSICQPINGYSHVSLLLSDDETLFHNEYRHKITANTENADSLAAMIGRSLRVIDEVSPALLSRMNQMVRWYVPIRSDDFRVHNSFTASTLLGVTFLSDAYNSLRLAEAMVHEYHHNQLFALMAGEELFEDVGGAIHYSPWRDDPRPLTGLFHALYVFANVWHFLQRTIEHPEFESIRDEIITEGVRLRWQLAIGLAQVPIGRVRPLGCEILGDIREIVAGLDGAPPVVLTHHLATWRSRNSLLTAFEL